LEVWPLTSVRSLITSPSRRTTIFARWLETPWSSSR